MNIPGPTEVHIRAMAAILSQPRVWHMSLEELQEVAAAATNGRARPWRVKCTVKIMRRGRGLDPMARGGAVMTDLDAEGRALSPAMQRTIEKFRAHVAQRERERVRVAAEQMAGLRDLAQRDQGETP